MLHLSCLSALIAEVLLTLFFEEVLCNIFNIHCIRLCLLMLGVAKAAKEHKTYTAY